MKVTARVLVIRVLLFIESRSEQMVILVVLRLVCLDVFGRKKSEKGGKGRETQSQDVFGRKKSEKERKVLKFSV